MHNRFGLVADKNNLCALAHRTVGWAELAKPINRDSAHRRGCRIHRDDRKRE